MADTKKVIKDLEEVNEYIHGRFQGWGYVTGEILTAIQTIKSQQAEIERLKAEKNSVIEQIENEINILHKESRNVKDEVGTAIYEWLINGFQASLDMIKDGEQE